MTHEQIKEARQELGLTLQQFAQVLDTDARTIRRMETSPDNSTHRAPAVRMVRLITAYRDGYRPADWPE
ncbi:MAG: helix-turn-helix transcriptional regulator [Pseudomonadota bacterium]